MSNNFIQVPGLYAQVNPLFDPNSDPYWANVATLLHFDGVQGGRTFTDVKGNPITSTGVVTDLGSPAIPPASLYFPGSAQKFSITENDNNATGDFTIEFYAKWETITNCTLVDTRPISNNGPWIDFFYYTGSFGIYFNGTTTVATTYAVTLNKVYHIALCRKGGIVRMFLDGALIFTWNYAGAMQIPRFFLGGNGYNETSDFFKGRFSEFRYTKGIGRYENPFKAEYIRFANKA